MYMYWIRMFLWKHHGILFSDFYFKHWWAFFGFWQGMIHVLFNMFILQKKKIYINVNFNKESIWLTMQTKVGYTVLTVTLLQKKQKNTNVK